MKQYTFEFRSVLFKGMKQYTFKSRSYHLKVWKKCEDDNVVYIEFRSYHLKVCNNIH